MLQNWKRELTLFVQARTGVTSALFVWAGVAAVASLIAFAFLCVTLYRWLALQLGDVFGGLVAAGIFLAVMVFAVLAAMMARRRAKARAILERAARAQGSSRLLDPKIVGFALKAGRTLGWQRVIPLALLAFLAAQWAREYRARADSGNR
jgi:hypothetical protein